MSRKTVFMVGMLMIAMLVGFGASAGAPADFEYDLVTGSRAAPPIDPVETDDDQNPRTVLDPPIKVVESWGGSINARSEPGQGTSMHILIPVEQSQGAGR